MMILFFVLTIARCCPVNCKTCLGACFECNNGYYLIPIVNICPSCRTGCATCLAETYCYSCTTKYYESSNMCYACPNECATCTSASVCSTCITGYYLSSQQCPQCPTGCATCTSTTYCSSCTTNYYLSSDQCLACPNSCENCTSPSSCSSCANGYYLSVSACLPCLNPCSKCINSDNQCSTCVDQINQIPPLCQCNTSSIMDPSTYICNQCTYPCATCQTTVSYCLTCASTYTHNSTNHTCYCLTNQYEDNGSPKQCQNCSNFCLTCQTNSTNCTSCDNSLNRQLDNNQCVCSEGFYDIGTCEKCTLPCNTCTSASVCLTCNDPAKIPPDCICNNQQYFDTSSNNCEFCQMPCLNCITTSSTCTSCLSNFYLSKNTCLQCSLPCQECIDTDTKCTACVNSYSQVVNTTCICNNGYYMDMGYVCQKCDKSCQTCINNSTNCLICANTYILSISISNKCECPQGYYQISSQNNCQQCPQICTKCQSNLFCTECSVGYYLESNICQKCNLACKSCISQTECTICNLNYYMEEQGLCQQCSDDCEQCTDQLKCNQCQIGYYIDQLLCEQCNDNCLTCINYQDYCQSCRINYELINNQCLCKSGYFEQNNECIKCNYPCQTCINLTNCQSCALIQHINLINNQCQCQQGYYYQNNQCINCYENCQTCINNSTYCLSCDIQKYRQLINNQCICINQYFELNNQCISCQSEQGKIQQNCQYKDCNDKQWTYGEQCDDGNNIIRDGCSNCQIDNNYSCFNELLQISICYQCSINCKQCQINQNIIECIQCQDGYFIDQYQCQKCSDKCIECQDNSNNCIKCRFINQTKQCQICEDQQGFYSDYINNKCYTKCGDSFKSSNEECDDGNILNNDGCDNQCKLEHKYICKDGICITPNYPIPQLQTIGDTSIYNNIRQFKLEYDQKLNITNEFNITNQISLFIVKDNQEQEIIYPYTITQQIDYDPQQALTFAAQLNLTLNKSSHYEVLMIKFMNQSQFTSLQGYPQQEANISILINDFIIIDQNTVTQVQTATQSNAYVLYVMGVMAGGAILFGGLDIFYNLLDTIQMLSYLKYTNIIMPYNLAAFFDFFGFAQLNIISKYLNLYKLIDPYIDYSKLKPIPDKIANDQLNSLFIINGSSLLVVWIFLLGTYSLATVLPGILNSYKPKYYSDKPGQDVWLIRFRLYYLAVKIFLTELCNIIVSEFFFSGMLRIQMSTAYDYCFSIFLQIYGFQLFSDDPLAVFSSYLALFASFIYVYTICSILKISNLSKFIRNTAIKDKYGSIFEGIKLNYYCKYFNSLLLIKKMLFMGILILGYNFPYFQVINLTLLSCFQSLFLILFKPLEDLKEFLKQLICEINTFITLLLLTVLAIDGEINYLSYENRQNIGWCCVFLISAILGIQLILDAIQQWQLLFKKYKQIKNLITRIQNLFRPQSNNQVTHNILEPV